MREIFSEILIEAPADYVWKKLTDFNSYSSWNPFIHIEQGEVRVGSSLLIRIMPPGSVAMTLRPRILTVAKGSELSWLGSLLIRGIFDGHHIFRIIPQNENKIVFQQIERFSGLFAPVILKSIESNLQRGFEEMNVALKDLIEANYSRE